MKVKYLFGALVLPVAFSACTSEEFEFAQAPSLNGSALDGRTKGVVTLSVDKADVEDENSTRVNGVQVGTTNSISWQWMDTEDKLGGVVVDYKPDGSVVDHKYLGGKSYVITNYPFAPQIDAPSAAADFTTPTAVVQGAYMFYSQYDGTAVQRGIISDEISRIQTVNAGWEKGLEQVGSDAELGGENFFVSPLVDLSVEDGAVNKNPLTLTSAHALLHIKLNSDVEAKYYEGNGFQINKIVLRTMGTGDEFKLEQTINPAAIDEIQKAVYVELDAKKNSIKNAFNTGAKYSINASHAQAREAMKCVMNKIQGKDILTGVETADEISVISEYSTTNTTTDLVYQLETPYSFKKAEDVFELLVIIPEGKYVKGTGAKEYQGTKEGVWHMTVYTSEGTYDQYIGKDEIVAHRGKKLNIHNRTLTIKGGQTNINLFDPNEAFNIESTEDYNYVIEYVNNHFRDFGNASDWKAPVLKLVAGKTIDVDAAHMFPNFPVKYIGGATLNVKGQNATYVFNPENIILGTGANRPTIKIDDAGSTIKFTMDVNGNVETDGDGENITRALKLESNAKIEIAEGKEVNFEKLVSGTNMTIGKKAKVNVIKSGKTETKGALTVGEEAAVNLTGDATFNGTTTVGKKAQVTAAAKLTTNGVVNVNEDADITVNGAYTNGSTMTIDKLATVTLNAASVNKKNSSITLEGTAELKSVTTFTNEENATILVKKCDNQMNDKTRAKAIFKNLNNDGNITLEASVDKKGTYGAYVEVTTKFTNGEKGKVSNNGEFIINEIENKGNLTLESDPYARFDVTDGLYTKDGKGSVVLADPTEYEMYDNYYTAKNKLNPNTVKGVIEATIDQAAYDKILVNNNSSELGTQERALDVLNKITVVGELKVKNLLLDDVDFVLPANAKLVAEETGLKINSLTANGASSLTTNLPNNQIATVTIKEMVNVNADFTIESRINANLPVKEESGAFTPKDTYVGALNVYSGKFTNNGSINTSVNDTKLPLFAVVKNGATIENKGAIGYYHTTVPAVTTYYSQAELDIINALNAAFKASQSYYTRVAAGDQSALVPKTPAYNATWSGATTTKFTFARWIKWVKAGCPSVFVDAGYTFLTFEKNDGNFVEPTVSDVVANNIDGVYATLKITGNTASTDVANLFCEANVNSTFTTANNLVMAFTPAVDPVLGHYLMVRKNFGTIDLTGATDDDKWTVGGIGDNTMGTKKGEFSTNVLETAGVILGAIGAM